jgi:plasmid stabilization system protein ParE
VKIAWLPSARHSLRVQVAFIAESNPAARRVRHRIHVAVSNLGLFPDSGRPGEIAGTRELPVPGLPYLIVYRVAGERVEILRVFHTSTNWPGALN